MDASDTTVAGSHTHTMHVAFQPEQIKAAMPKDPDGRPMKEVLGRRGTDLTTGGWEAAVS